MESIFGENNHVEIEVVFVYTSPPKIPEVSIPEKPVTGIVSPLRIEINRGLAAMHDIVSGKDLKKFLSVSDRINCGVHVFTPEIFTAIQGVSTQRKERAILRPQYSFEALQSATRRLPVEFVRLDQDILSTLA